MSRVTQIPITVDFPEGSPPCCCGDEWIDCPDGWYVFMPLGNTELPDEFVWAAMPGTWACHCLVGAGVCAGHPPNVSANDFVVMYGWSHFVGVRCAPPYDILWIDTPPVCP